MSKVTYWSVTKTGFQMRICPFMHCEWTFIPIVNIYWVSDTCLDLFLLKIKRCKEIILAEVWTQGKGSRKWKLLWSAQSYLSASVLWGGDIWSFHRSVLSKVTQLKDIGCWLKIQIPACFWFIRLRCGTYESLFLTGSEVIKRSIVRNIIILW